MKRKLLMILLALGMAVACGKKKKTETATKDPTPDPDPIEETDPTEGLPGPDGAEILTYITETNPYTDWKFFPGSNYPVSFKTDYLRPGSHHFFNGMIARTYVNDIGGDALDEGSTETPAGTMVITERWTPDEFGEIGPEDSPESVVAMYKIEDYNSDNGDWFYMVVAGGEVADEGQIEACQDCHRQVEDNDFRFLDSGQISLLAPTDTDGLSANDGGDSVLKSLLKDFHYSHYEQIPDDQISETIARSEDLEEGIEWFNGRLSARLFANPTAMEVINNDEVEYPYGSMIIAEQYKKTDGFTNEEPFAVVAQIKIKGSDARRGDWVWFSYSFDDDRVLSYAKQARSFCGDCHVQVSKNDFVWTTSEKSLPTPKN